MSLRSFFRSVYPNQQRPPANHWKEAVFLAPSMAVQRRNLSRGLWVAEDRIEVISLPGHPYISTFCLLPLLSDLADHYRVTNHWKPEAYWELSRGVLASFSSEVGRVDDRLRCSGGTPAYPQSDSTVFTLWKELEVRAPRKQGKLRTFALPVDLGGLLAGHSGLNTRTSGPLAGMWPLGLVQSLALLLAVPRRVQCLKTYPVMCAGDTIHAQGKGWTPYLFKTDTGIRISSTSESRVGDAKFQMGQLIACPHA